MKPNQSLQNHKLHYIREAMLNQKNLNSTHFIKWSISFRYIFLLLCGHKRDNIFPCTTEVLENLTTLSPIGICIICESV